MTVKALSIIIITILLSVQAFSGEKEKEVVNNNINSIHGKVTDIHNGQTVAGAVVILQETQQKTYTDFEGNFTFENLKEGKYTLITSMISYKSKQSRVQLQPSTKSITFQLESL